MKNCGKNGASCTYVLRLSLNQFKQDNLTFWLKNLKFESSNLFMSLFVKDAKGNIWRNGLSSKKANKF